MDLHVAVAVGEEGDLPDEGVLAFDLEGDFRRLALGDERCEVVALTAQLACTPASWT